MTLKNFLFLGGENRYMYSKHKSLIMVLIFLLCFINIGCQKKDKTGKEEKKELSLYIDVKDKYSLSVIKFIVDEFKKENEDIKVNVNTPLDSNKLKDDIIQGNSGDIIFTSRNTMIELGRKGLLNDLNNLYSKNKVNDKFYNILSTYGRIGDKYFGIALVPFSLEIFYSNLNLQKLGMNPPQNINDIVSILKRLNEEKIRVPVVLTEDLEINNGLASIFFSNSMDMQKIEKSYDSGKKSYQELVEIQKIFNDEYYLVKQGVINKESFELGNENSMNKLTNGDVPLLIGISYLAKDIKDTNIGIVDKYNISKNKENIPIIVNCIACTPTSIKNEESANTFATFILSEKVQKALAKEGFVTGSKKANEDSTGINKIIVKHISEANLNSILYVYNFPKIFQSQFEAKLARVLGGKYNDNEWKEITDDVYNK